MINKPAWLFNQSAVVPYKKTAQTTEIVLVTSSSSKNWVLPKGVIERFMSPEESAAKEAYEEAGVIGDILSELIIEYEYKKWGGICKVKVFPLRVLQILDEWEEMDKRKRIVVDINKAIDLIKQEQKVVLVRFKEWLKEK